MRHRACGLALIVILATGARVAAQEPVVRFGITGGVNVSEVNVKGSESLNVALQHLWWQPVGGILLAIHVTDTFTIQPEALWSRKGTLVELESGEGRLTLTYLDVPILARYEVPRYAEKRFHVFAGPYGAWRLRARSRTELDGTVIERSVDDEVEQIDWGFVTGVGVELGGAFGPAFVMDFRYGFGVQDIIESPAAFPGQIASPDFTYRNRAFTGLLAIRF